ncbi:MAG: PAS domain-containing sensor histidine kinase, partial [Deltaproteobacteria bacterium]|nr:PAS domain-containing sensor histidine kinase [Deltaproteobacteria bacterium]
MSTGPHGDDLKKRVIWLMTYRMVIVTLLMGATALIHPKEGGTLLPHSIIPIYVLLGTSYLFTILSLITITVVKEIDLFADIQVVADMLLATALVYVTGGIDSIFSFLYIFIIMGAGIVLHGRLVFLTASLSSILYGALLDLQYYGYLPLIGRPLGQPQSYSDLQILYKIFINITAFYIVAFLSSHLFI